MRWNNCPLGLCIALSTLLMTTLSACSPRQFYASGQAWQKTECHKVTDLDQRKRCLDSSALNFEDYRRQAAEAGGKH